jgi:hypothetical protein
VQLRDATKKLLGNSMYERLRASVLGDRVAVRSETRRAEPSVLEK